jgi:hypothetical protein
MEEENNPLEEQLEETIEETANEALNRLDTSTPEGIEAIQDVKNLIDQFANMRGMGDYPAPIGMNQFYFVSEDNMSIPTVEYLTSKGVLLSDIYFPGDERVVLNNITNTNDVKKLQKKLQSAGYLKSDEYRPGQIQSSTYTAMYKLMGEANRIGSDWSNLLDEIVVSPLYDPSDLPEFQEPDFVTLTNDVINTVKQEIGRTPTQSEIDILTSIFAGLKEKEFQEGIDALTDTLQPGYAKKKVFDPETETFVEQVVETSPAVAQQSAFDANERFQAKVRELFKPEMDFNQRREQTRNVANIIKSSVAGLRSIGG